MILLVMAVCMMYSSFTLKRTGRPGISSMNLQTTRIIVPMILRKMRKEGSIENGT